ncbi:betaine aldehyde dehydrogenase, putative [Talaromyces stipitatus ATCC 10500]|uniref:Betaine aldehyde dehydrogenase, putative n=1 Tax=Talaromyces stipitatus (strain ATCC 10500 / CBS 375.48 / QM 6759 / NRRL 1006) TaxID=441959 RepID=B8LVG9_TALSN|nr:betaine aldehyde dehydrogenase, putative [Talaromyces stipitatus ATCC 10500]EED23988.1 betaine aldehyde dehydrogenase, putative [Talaromyces stipitatus ATCC 10500]
MLACLAMYLAITNNKTDMQVEQIITMLPSNPEILVLYREFYCRVLLTVEIAQPGEVLSSFPFSQDWSTSVYTPVQDPTLLHFDSYVNNSTGVTWASCPDNGPDELPAVVEPAYASFVEYRKLTPRQRAQLLMRWCTQMCEAREDLAQLLTHETAKPLAESYAELDAKPTASKATVFLAAAPGCRIFTIKQLIGVAIALVPWNFPVAMVLRTAGAALAAGCTLLVKPSPETPITVLALAHLAEKVRFGPGVCNVLTTGQKSLFHGLDKGEQVDCGPMLTRTENVTLELGGNCPFIIFDDVNFDQAISQLTVLKWRHAGQVCITANQIFVKSGIYQKFTQMLKERVSSTLVVGHGQLLEESFASIASQCKFETKEEAMGLANDSSMGLASYVFTQDVNRLWRMFENLEAGMASLNTGNQSASETPFGGIKQSGYGKESGKNVAGNEFLVTKSATLTLEGHF